MVPTSEPDHSLRVRRQMELLEDVSLQSTGWACSAGRHRQGAEQGGGGDRHVGGGGEGKGERKGGGAKGPREGHRRGGGGQGRGGREQWPLPARRMCLLKGRLRGLAAAYLIKCADFHRSDTMHPSKKQGTCASDLSLLLAIDEGQGGGDGGGSQAEGAEHLRDHQGEDVGLSPPKYSSPVSLD